MDVLKKLLPYVKTYKLFAIIAPLFMCVEVVMDLLQPTLMQKIIDEGIANQDNGYVIKMGILMLLCAVIGLIGGMGNSVFATKASVHFAADLRKDVFTKIEKFSNRNVDSFGTGKLITIVTNDIATVQHAFMLTLRIFVRGPLLFIGSVIIVWFTARELFPILLVVIPILICCIYFFSVKSAKLFSYVQKAMDKVNGKLQETLAGIRVIKAFGRHEYEKKQFQTINDLLMKRNLTAEQLSISLMPIMMLFVNFGIVAGLWLGVIKVNEGSLQVGVILAFINYLNIMMNGLMTSSSVIMQIARSIPSAKRIVQIFDTKMELDEPKMSPLKNICGDVEFKNVCFRYGKDGEYVLKNISFHVKGGQKVGIIGPTGSGKSTLVKLLPRLYDPDSGEIFIDGVNIKEIPLEKLRSAIGFVPQKATLFSGTIKDNLRFGKEDATSSNLEQAARSAAALEFINKFEKKFDHELMQGATNLSGGQKQRLSLARAFVREPKILVLDDSTSAVDALSERSIQQVLKKNNDKDATVWIISSKISSIVDADQIIVLNDGEIDGIGTHKELLKKSKVYQDIYLSQRGKEVEYV